MTIDGGLEFSAITGEIAVGIGGDELQFARLRGDAGCGRDACRPHRVGARSNRNFIVAAGGSAGPDGGRVIMRGRRIATECAAPCTRRAGAAAECATIVAISGCAGTDGRAVSAAGTRARADGNALGAGRKKQLVGIAGGDVAGSVRGDDQFAANRLRGFAGGGGNAAKRVGVGCRAKDLLVVAGRRGSLAKGSGVGVSGTGALTNSSCPGSGGCAELADGGRIVARGG